VEEHIQKELVVVESNTICNPGAMVVHFQNASVALGAVMASIRLCLETPLANSDATKFFLFD